MSITQEHATDTLPASPPAVATVGTLILYMETRYRVCCQKAEELEAKGAKIKNRLFWARALEAAVFLYSLSDTVLIGDRTYWENRVNEIQAKVYNRKPRIAETGEEDRTEA